MENLVLLDVADGVATLTLNRPDALNALSVGMLEALCQAVRRVRDDDRMAVLVIRGAGGHFMAGGDIHDFAARLAQEPGGRLVSFRAIVERYVNPTVEMLQALPQPVIAQVEGACAGFGLSLMLGCDLALCADDALFTTGYAGIGLSADGGMSYFLPRVVGRRKAMELMLLAERFGAAEALQLGLVNRVSTKAALAGEVAALAARLRGGPRRAYGEIKRLLNDSPNERIEAQLQREAEAFARCSASADFQEGIEAFLNKRPARFGGA